MAYLQTADASVQQSASTDMDLLSSLQSNLFTVGSQLATPPEKELTIQGIGDHHVAQLEAAIDRLDADLPPLKSFVLPGGSIQIAHCHVCRTVARRAERCVVALMHHSEVDPLLVRFLNRLSDYFFTLARAIGNWQHIPDSPWKADA
jgi:cob(I)alamin adenosyltransferase